MDIALFHSVLGVRPGIEDAADRLRAAGHDVVVVDQYRGRMFDDYDEAAAFATSIGYPTLMSDALAAVEGLTDGFAAVGFSNGGGMAEFVAAHRRTSAVVQCSGALPPQAIGLDGWPPSTPAQIHYSLDDPFRDEDWVRATTSAIEAAGVRHELHLDYPGDGHLFTDRSLPDEFDADATEQLFERVLRFLAEVS